MSACILIFFILLIFLFLILCACRTTPRIPLQYYPIIFSCPIAFYIICQHFKKATIFSCIFNLTLQEGYFQSAFIYSVILCIWVTIVYIVIAANNSLQRSVILSLPAKIKILIGLLFHIITISIVLLLIYIGLRNGYCGNSSNSFAIFTAVITLSAALYTAQRTLKRELTKNRQDWINNVRLESITLIATAEKIRVYRNRYRDTGYFDEDQIMQLESSLIDSCIKLKMFLNPNDLISPILIKQLDLITLNKDVMAHNNFWENINLKLSFMPWVKVLLKVEWERVKAILESREVISNRYYSKQVYFDEWSKQDFKNYGINFNTAIKNLSPFLASSLQEKDEDEQGIENVINDLKTKLRD